jgi:REP-associated tyrosine transposase
MGLYKNKYRIESARLENWDYSIPWWYYVTICTKDMRSCFGEIKNGGIKLNKYGKIVKEEWSRTKEIRKKVDLDYFVIMPNHLHGIIIIEGPEHKNNSRDYVVETHRDASLQIVKNNLSHIIKGFKGACTNRIHQSGFPSFQWQPRFYDHIIRNEMDLHRIRTYIDNNPLKWEIDEYYNM